MHALIVIKRSKDAKVKLELLSRRYPSEFGVRESSDPSTATTTSQSR